MSEFQTPVLKWRDPVIRQRLSLALATLFVLVAFSLFRPVILSAGNIENILVQSSYLMLFACAQAVVILTRGLDLSLGVSVSLISVVSALVMAQAGLGAGILAGVAVSLAIGLFNGAWIAGLGINPFIVTLGTMNIVMTLATTVSGGFPVAPLADEFLLLARARPFGVPVQIIVAATALIVTHIVLSRTVFGRALTIIGSAPRAARAAGISVRFHLCGAYLVCSMLIALGALMLTARVGAGEPNLGNDLALSSIAAAVLGGMRLRGGEGDVCAAFLGALFVTVFSNCMNLADINGYIQKILLGIVIIVSLGLDKSRTKAR
ncbi:ABC transporter permease [Brenneria goodwinii]|uniref:ABC transporter permease n=1 Tax=Brenneria goodwinii TaxID=1109412 RepID=UPI000EF1E05A|nr:ABC transporter permease [Brenneria goodwinii]MCG8155523.1 ABC transporter permease [Brenneria goodwinii]MCG8160450.1 ABC transporter permease [Brenneria goodwinii]MCG8164973.1 ABC transporter permease [Brenneria goodwinii]MCG8169370.1 ABC transporter permease [Brenneria goodwinii]MCG8174544.1 ABC transporter permease [Brenneria goodwinii]